MRGERDGRPADDGAAAGFAAPAGPDARCRLGSVEAPELPGLSRACAVLAAGGAVVVPNPGPLTYGIVATSARVVNEVKRRPAGQSVAVSLHAAQQWQRVVPAVDLPPAALPAVVALLDLRLSVLLPLHGGAPLPDWVGPAVRDGWLAAFNGFWAPTDRLWRRFPRLYGSSANLTGRKPAADAAQAAAMFGAGCTIVDAGGLGEPPVARSASTMVRVDRAGRLELVRSGAQDATSGLAMNEYGNALAGSVGLPTGQVAHASTTPPTT